MMSIFSFLSSETTALTRLPRGPTQAPVAPAHGQAGAAPSLPDLQQVHLQPLSVLVALVRHLLAGRQDRLDPTEIDQRHPSVGLLYDAGHDIAHALAVLLQQLLVVNLVQTLVERLTHHLGRYTREVVRGYVLAVLHNPEIACVLVEDYPRLLLSPLATLVSREQRLLEYTLYRLEGYAFVRLYLA